jgi:hypothetical protein
MHTYREAILNKINKNERQRPIWVIALYPGDKLDLFPEVRDRVSTAGLDNIKEELKNLQENNDDILFRSGVGAIPMRPKYMKDKEYRELISGFINSIKLK